MALGSDARVEVIDGELVEMAGHVALWAMMCSSIYDLLYPVTKQERRGLLFMHGLIYLLKMQSEIVREAYVPDVSFLAKERVLPDRDLRRPPNVAPTLAVEIIMPEDNAETTHYKTREYLNAGTEQVWLVYPRQKEVHQYRRGESIVQTYSGNTALDADALFPGLSLPLADIFALPALRK